ncbi:hypothetical protein OEZ85_003829 [Tetradesmus obliquus]|uniref:PCIF1 WW domain-containing protein n=1 Tax=Tetradesmus obliquus TaxID=3088 RepID=A0ABY8UCU6_TETOB|nr:hypothetical protein OEZ85_003829 [Tetradesmus obliquus]
MARKKNSESAATEQKHAHEHTNVQPTGLGKQIVSTPGRLAKGPLQELCQSQPAPKWAPRAVPHSACPTSPAAAVELELLRAAALDSLRHKLASLCAKAGLRNVPMLAFERWRFAAKWAEDEPQLALGMPHSLDLTCGKSFVKVSRASYGKLARLYRTHWLSAAGQPAAAADCTVGLPMDEAAAALQAMQAAASAGNDADAEATGSDDEEEEDEAAAAAAAGGGAHHVVLCAEAKIAELEQQQQQQQQQGEGNTERTALHQRLFALLLRYKSIQGHGFQAAAGPPVFELLRQKLAVGFECFASPLNAHFNKFGSAFPDVDGPFGSAGSFFRMQLKHGSYEANPPFVPALLTATAQHVLALLQQAEAAGGALSFCVLVPGWTEVAGWGLMNSSSFLQRSLVVAAADHGYCDGASHQRCDLYRQSPYDSAILFLQTTAAAAKWPVHDGLLQQLQAAMASCCPSEAAAERQRKQRGLFDLEWRGLGTPVLKYEVDAEGEGSRDNQQQQQQQQQQGPAVAKQQKKRKKKRKSTTGPPEQQQQQQQGQTVQKQSSEQQDRPKKKQKKKQK